MKMAGLKEAAAITTALAALGLLAGCGGGDGGSSDVTPTPAPQPAAALAGFWTTAAGDAAVLALESGEVWAIDTTGTAYKGQVSASGQSFSGTISGWQGTAKDTGSIQGSFVPKQSITATLRAPSIGTQNLQFQYVTGYDQPANMQAYAGSYRADSGAMLSISASGNVNGSEGTCGFSGTVTAAENGKNFFRFKLQYANTAACGYFSGKATEGIAAPVDAKTLYTAEVATDGSVASPNRLVKQ